MAVWTPGSYLVREYARHVEGVAARGADGRSLAVAKTRKNRWRIDARGADRVTLTYRVYAREMSVRTNWVERGFALLNGAPTFITLAETAVKRPHLVFARVAAGVEDQRHQPARGRRAGRTAIEPRTMTNWWTARSWRATPRCTSSRSAGGSTRSRAKAKPASGTARARRGDLERLVRANEQLWGALPYRSTCSST